jgi:LysR family glycine cleavage system transcriptional activator
MHGGSPRDFIAVSCGSSDGAPVPSCQYGMSFSNANLMHGRLPPLNPLRVFTIAAQHVSFTRAAEELHVNQSAVSRQIAVLEGVLGIRLFLRSRSGLKLSPEGEHYYAAVAPAFTAIAAATAELTNSAETEPLRLQVYSTFMAKWLMRRLPRFHGAHPSTQVRVTSSVVPVDFSRHRVDAAIQLGDERTWPSSQVTFLFADTFQPVCSPNLLKGKDGVEQPQDLLKFPLLHSHYRRKDWPDWLGSLGVLLPPELEPIEFASSLLTYQAAIDGLGIAMGQPRFLSREIESGELICPYPHAYMRPLSYFLISPETTSKKRHMRVFRMWLLSEIEKDG